MAETALTDPTGPAPVSGRRAEVLELLRGADGPLTVADVARATGLHTNTARFHLDQLVADALVERSAEKRDQPGRPKVLYRARAGAAPGIRSFQLLAEMMTSLVSATVDDPRDAAVEAGRRWGRHLGDRSSPYEAVDADEAVTRLSATLDAIGFEPAAVATPAGPEVHLRHCPFREVAERHQDIVCALHLGLMRGVLEELDAPLTADRLDPLVEPSLCIAQLRERARPARAPKGSRAGRGKRRA